MGVGGDGVRRRRFRFGVAVGCRGLRLLPFGGAGAAQSYSDEDSEETASAFVPALLRQCLLRVARFDLAASLVPCLGADARPALVLLNC